PLGDEVVQRTAGRHAGHDVAGMTKGDAAVHAPRALIAQGGDRQLLRELIPVAQPVSRIPLRRGLTRKLFETCRFTHDSCRSSMKMACRQSTSTAGRDEFSVDLLHDM